MSAEPIGINQQIAEVRRELGMRRHVYDRFVRIEKLTQQQADERITRLEAVLATLERVRDEQAAKVTQGLF
jgi:hypothetical protein